MRAGKEFAISTIAESDRNPRTSLVSHMSSPALALIGGVTAYLRLILPSECHITFQRLLLITTVRIDILPEEAPDLPIFAIYGDQMNRTVEIDALYVKGLSQRMSAAVNFSLMRPGSTRYLKFAAAVNELFFAINVLTRKEDPALAVLTKQNMAGTIRSAFAGLTQGK